VKRGDRDWVPFRVRVRCAARAAWGCLRGDYTVERVPTGPVPLRAPGMCRTLSDCARTCHLLEQSEARVGELSGRKARR